MSIAQGHITTIKIWKKVMTQEGKKVSTNNNLSEEKGEPDRNRTDVLLFTSLTPYR